jgi:hypothetical protein
MLSFHDLRGKKVHLFGMRLRVGSYLKMGKWFKATRSLGCVHSAFQLQTWYIQCIKEFEVWEFDTATCIYIVDLHQFTRKNIRQEKSTCGCLVIRMMPVSHICILGLSTAATSRRLKVDGYRKKKETKDSTHTSSCTPGTVFTCHSWSPSDRWLIKYTWPRHQSPFSSNKTFF